MKVLMTIFTCVFSTYPTGLSSKSQAQFNYSHSVHITSLLACRGSLWVGTNLGVLVNFPLPRLEGVPLVNGPAMVSYHSHSGPVKFLHALEISRQDDKIQFSSKEDSKSRKFEECLFFWVGLDFIFNISFEDTHYKISCILCS